MDGHIVVYLEVKDNKVSLNLYYDFWLHYHQFVILIDKKFKDKVKRIYRNQCPDCEKTMFTIDMDKRTMLCCGFDDAGYVGFGFPRAKHTYGWSDKIYYV